MITSFILIYLLLTLAIGFWASKKVKTSSDFMLAGKSLSTSFVGVTLFATWFGSSQIMGTPHNFIENGFSSFMTLIVAGSLCLILVGQFYAPKLYRMNIVTVNDFFRIKYNKKIELVTSLLMVFSYPQWVAAQFVALAYLLNGLLGIPADYGIFLGAGIVILYTYVGGMWAVSYTDMIQSIMILLGLIILLVEILNQTGGIVPLFENKPSSFFSPFPQGGLEAWSEYIALFLALSIGSIPVQEIYQRVFSAKNEKAAKNGLFLGSFLLFIIASIPLIIGLAGAYLNPELMEQGIKQDIIPVLVSMHTSLPLQILFYGAMISAILSTSSGAMLSPATVIGENLIKPYIPNLSDKRLLLITRMSVIGIALVACYFALDDSDIVKLVEASVSLILVCLFAPFTFGLFWKKSSIKGAWSSIILGGLSWLLGAVYDTAIDPTIYGTIISCLAMVFGSLLYPEEASAT